MLPVTSSGLIGVVPRVWVSVVRHSRRPPARALVGGNTLNLNSTALHRLALGGGTAAGRETQRGTIAIDVSEARAVV